MMLFSIFKNNRLPLIGAWFLAALWSCGEIDEMPLEPFRKDSSTVSATDEWLVNRWIKEKMDIYYFWNKEMPALTPESIPDPKEYFKRLLYKDDRFSWMTDDAEKLKNEMDGIVVSQGFSPSFGQFTNTKGVFIIVEYVYKDSPAEKAGLQRGNIILAIDGQDLTLENYQKLYQNAHTITLGEFTDSGIKKTGIQLTLTPGEIEMNPVLHWEVKEIDGKKIGYLVYAEFISGPNDRWLDELNNALKEIKNRGADELIVDLRYNSGGEAYAAGLFASAIAPKEVVEHHEVFVRFDYNKNLQEYFLETEGRNSDNLLMRFPSSELNLNLDRVVFLTGRGTASASELLIKGLDPYMEVVTVGEKTVGKFYGAIVMEDKTKPRRHNYAIIPLVLKYQNAEGFTDFINGLAPDLKVYDDLLHAKPFGDLTDPILATAIETLTGRSPTTARLKPSIPYNKLENIDKLRKGSILMPDQVDLEKLI